MGEATTSAEHGDALYRTKAPEEVSWFQADPATSERLIRPLARPSDGVVDVGAGASRLADVLLTAGWSDVTLLDVSHEALELVRGRLSGRAGASFVVADVLSWRPGRTFRVWHDRAVFPFLGEPRAQQAYVEVAGGAVEPGGAAVIATFAADGPTVCSGLPAARYGAAELGARFGSAFLLEHAEREEHVTPWGAVQAFTWVVLRRTADG